MRLTLFLFYTCMYFYNGYIIDACSKYQGAHEEATTKQSSKKSSSITDGEGLSLDHQGNQKVSSFSLGSLGSKASGIQKIIPANVDVSTFFLRALCASTLTSSAFLFGKLINFTKVGLQANDDYWFRSDPEVSITNLWGK